MNHGPPESFDLRSKFACSLANASRRFSALHISGRTPGRQLNSVLSNRLVPRFAELAFKPGEHRVNGVRLVLPDGPGVGSGGERTLGRYPELTVLFEVSGASEDRHRVSLETLRHLADSGFDFGVIDASGAPRRADLASLEARMRMPRCQDALFNVVAEKRPGDSSGELGDRS